MNFPSDYAPVFVLIGRPHIYIYIYIYIYLCIYICPLGPASVLAQALRVVAL